MPRTSTSRTRRCPARPPAAAIVCVSTTSVVAVHAVLVEHVDRSCARARRSTAAGDWTTTSAPTRLRASRVSVDAHVLHDAAEHDDRGDAEGDAEEEEQQPRPGRRASRARPCGGRSSSTRRRRAGRSRALDDAAVAQRDRFVGQRRQLGIVRDEHERAAALAVDGHEQIDHLPAGGAVEIAGRLVGEQDRRIVRERARDRDALLLAARELRRIVMAAIGRARRPRAAPARAPRASGAPAISIGTRTFSNAVSDGSR